VAGSEARGFPPCRLSRRLCRLTGARPDTTMGASSQFRRWPAVALRMPSVTSTWATARAADWKGHPVRQVCELRRLVGRCGRPVAGTCQYCGRAFCSGHGALLGDGQEICSRSRCQHKRVDLERHLLYKAFVRERNAGGRCGMPGCESGPSGQCSRCRGFYCGRHLADRHVSVRQGRAWVQQPASMCDHCWQRRPLWSQL